MSFIGLIVWVALIFRYRRQWGYTIPALIWLADVFLFNLIAVLHATGVIDVDVAFLNAWSASTRIYALLLLVGGGAILLVEGKGEKIFDELS